MFSKTTQHKALTKCQFYKRGLPRHSSSGGKDDNVYSMEFIFNQKWPFLFIWSYSKHINVRFGLN